ncbi:MAG TPA: hypothetical protein VFL85_02990 [Candidatus Saccharimonadales bacterium]|nr:hypothetical protein [Candidatus Saccharimonadales bacterium]
MDLTNRSAQPQSYQPGNQLGGTAAPQSARPKSPGSRRDDNDKSEVSRVFHFSRMILVCVTVLLFVALVGLIYFSQPASQAKFVKKDDLQAVFLNSGQVYFGNISDVTNNYLTLTNIYYLQTSGNNSKDANVSLVKLGCELHEPYDQMIINTDQVTFWENLQDNGKVATAVKNFEKQNPNGQQCSEQTSAPTGNNSSVQGNNSSSSNTQNSTSNSSSSNSSNSSSSNKTTTTPKKP